LQCPALPTFRKKGGRQAREKPSRALQKVTKEIQVEVWKDLPGQEGRYQVSNTGSVRSLPHHVRLVAKGKETTRLSPGRVLKPGTQQSGHLSVAIGKGNSRVVHQLVLEAFVGPCPDGCEVLHLNHNPADNRLENLRYGTRSENMKMDYAAGTRKPHRNFNRWGHRYE
jgi:hypothetical protein